MGNSGLNRISDCNDNLIDEPIENSIFSDLDIIDEPTESLSDTVIINRDFNCDTHIVENTNDNSENRNDE